MKKTILVLGCLLAIGFSSVSCNRDDGLPESAVNIRSILPNRADHLIASMLGEPIYDAGSGYTTKNTPNPFGTEVYTGVTVSSVVKLDAADPANGAIYKVVLSNGIELGFKQDGDWAYVDGKGVLLKTSVWSYLPPAVDAAIRASSNSITTIAKIEVSAATPHVYTVTFQSGAVAKYNANGSVAP